MALSIHLKHLSDDELCVRCAWLYFVGGVSQAEVAEQLGITRARVNKLIGEARERNIVTVTVNVNDASTRINQIEQELGARWSLDFCIVTPPMGLLMGDGLSDQVQDSHRRIARRAVGMAAANYLHGHLTTGKALTVGVGWGRTLEQMALHLSGAQNSSARFVSVMGSLTRNSASNPFEVVHTLANRTGGQGHFLPVPFIADSVSDLKVFMSQRVVREGLDLARKADFVMTSVGELRDHSLVIAQEMISRQEYKSIQKMGAIGDVLGRFFDSSGQPVAHDLNQRTAAVPWNDIQRVPLILLVAGQDKIVPLLALLGAQMVKGLIIDGDSAEHLLKNK